MKPGLPLRTIGVLLRNALLGGNVASLQLLRELYVSHPSFHCRMVKIYPLSPECRAWCHAGAYGRLCAERTSQTGSCSQAA